MDNFARYSNITTKNPREIVLLRASGCRWRRCRFCDYHLDYSRDTAANYTLNHAVLAQVCGQYQRLEVINSGSFCDLDAATMDEIVRVCHEKNIQTVHWECHWRDRAHIAPLRARMAQQGIQCQIKIGIETFDVNFREQVLDKGIDETDPARIAALFDECCLLAGLTGQTADSMRGDIETALTHFSRVCVNLMTANRAPLQPDDAVCHLFRTQVAPHYLAHPRVDILMQNTDFGVGESHA